MIYLATIEQFLFWGGLLVFMLGLAMYAGRTKDFRYLIEFWKPTMELNRLEFNVIRGGMMMMITAVVIRIGLFVLN
jgi:hypothetical protein